MPITKSERAAALVRNTKFAAQSYRDLAEKLMSYANVLDSVDDVYSACPLITLNDLSPVISNSARVSVLLDTQNFVKPAAAS